MLLELLENFKNLSVAQLEAFLTLNDDLRAIDEAATRSGETDALCA
jgi:hypothetical protein